MKIKTLLEIVVMFSIKLCEQWTGLCNQLFALVNGILLAKQGRHQVACIASFSPAIKSARRIPLSRVLDLEKTGKNLGIKLVDRCRQRNPPPLPKRSMCWYNFVNQARFNTTIKKLCFVEPYYQLANKLIAEHFQEGDKINVVHFRIEQDGIAHWSRMNKLPPQRYVQILKQKYLTAVRKHVPKGEKILALTYSINHPIIRELQKEYTIVTINGDQQVKKLLGIQGREVSAILDLILGSRCNGVFVGCHNLQKKRGSTFSYVIYQLSTPYKTVLMDLDAIRSGLVVV